MPSAKGQTEDENFQRLDRQNKYLQRRMNVKKYFYVKSFRRRRRTDGVENGLYGYYRWAELPIIYISYVICLIVSRDAKTTGALPTVLLNTVS